MQAIIWRLINMLFKNLEYLPFIEDEDYLDYDSCLKIIQEYTKSGVFASDSFDNDIWFLKSSFSKGHKKKFDFSVFSLSKEKVRLIKSWLVNMLQEYTIQTCNNYFIELTKAINQSEFFDTNQIENFREWLEYGPISNNQKIYIVNTSISLIDYCKLPINPEYMLTLMEFKSKLIFKQASRVIPTSRFVLQFSYILNDYLKDLNRDNIKSNQKNLRRFLLYYPLKIWWELTTIIPMRSSEFCLLDRNCLSVEEGEFYIKVQRIKGKKKLQVFKLNTDIYEMIRLYYDATEEYGYSETLISYRSLIEIDYNNNRAKQKLDLSQFNLNNMLKLLKKFYDEVVDIEYGVSIDKNNRLKPNDTRHIAFLSLMMQGIAPVEVANIGGHSTLEAQYSYSYHTEYWIDHEVFKLMQNYNTSNYLTQLNASSINRKIKINAFKKPTSDFRGELNLGFCSDQLQRCESHECISCSHWRIDPKDLSKLNKEVLMKIEKTRNRIFELMPFIYDLNRILIKNEVEDYHAFEVRKQETLNKINSKINNIAALTLLSSQGSDFNSY